MRLSLVFPDGAPSRFAVALRSGTVATLEQRLADARRGAARRTPVEAAELLLELVALLDTHDVLTRGHSERVRAYAQSIGKQMGLRREELDLLNWAALLHDVGKLEVPHEILTRQSRPTDVEWELLRQHPGAGAELATPLRDWLGEWFGAIEEHHERWDGAGYPHRLAGTEISLAGRIVAVADVYDVITSSRSYKDACSAEAARRELSRCAGTHFDPDVVRAFLALSLAPRRVLARSVAWLAHAAVLTRVPLAPAVGAASAAAVALGTATPNVATQEPVVAAPHVSSTISHRPAPGLSTRHGATAARARATRASTRESVADDAPSLAGTDRASEPPDGPTRTTAAELPNGVSPDTGGDGADDPRDTSPPPDDPLPLDPDIVPPLEPVTDTVSEIVHEAVEIIESVVPLPPPPLPSPPPLPPPPALPTARSMPGAASPA